MNVALSERWEYSSRKLVLGHPHVLEVVPVRRLDELQLALDPIGGVGLAMGLPLAWRVPLNEYSELHVASSENPNAVYVVPGGADSPRRPWCATLLFYGARS